MARVRKGRHLHRIIEHQGSPPTASSTTSTGFRYTPTVEGARLVNRMTTPNLLLCEGCDTEIRRLLSNPSLDKVPDDDWYCDVAKKAEMKHDRKAFEKIVKTMPQEMR